MGAHIYYMGSHVYCVVSHKVSWASTPVVWVATSEGGRPQVFVGSHTFGMGVHMLWVEAHALGVDRHMQRMGFQETLVESHALTMGAHMLGVAAHELRVVAQRLVAHELPRGHPQVALGSHELLWVSTTLGGKPRVWLAAHARALEGLGHPQYGLESHAFPRSLLAWSHVAWLVRSHVLGGST